MVVSRYTCLLPGVIIYINIARNPDVSTQSGFTADIYNKSI